MLEENIVFKTTDSKHVYAVAERSVLIELTDAGKKIQQKAKCIPEELNKTFGMDDEDYQEIKSKLDQMLMQLN